MKEELNLKLANIIANDVFKLKKGDTVFVSADKDSNFGFINTFLEVCFEKGAIAGSYQIAKAPDSYKAVDPYVPNGFEESLLQADVWIDFGTSTLLYSSLFERVMEKNKGIRYLNLAVDSDLINILYNIDIEKTDALCHRIKSLADKAKKMRITNPYGTDVTFDLDPSHLVAVDSGVCVNPGFYTPPALVNFVPKFGTMAGELVLDAVGIGPEWIVLKEKMTFVVENGKISNIKGDEVNVDRLETWLQSYEDEVSYKIAHTNIGMAPNITEYYNDILMDERRYGAMNWGFGHVSPLDAPPHGQPCSSHFDCVMENATVYIDDVCILKDGKFTDKVKYE